MATTIKTVCEAVEQREVLYSINENVKFQLYYKKSHQNTRDTCFSQSSYHMSGHMDKENEVNTPKSNSNETINSSQDKQSV